jgi:hypothetical protein
MTELLTGLPRRLAMAHVQALAQALTEFGPAA